MGLVANRIQLGLLALIGNGCSTWKQSVRLGWLGLFGYSPLIRAFHSPSTDFVLFGEPVIRA